MILAADITQCASDIPGSSTWEKLVDKARQVNDRLLDRTGWPGLCHRLCAL